MKSTSFVVAAAALALSAGAALAQKPPPARAASAGIMMQPLAHDDRSFAEKAGDAGTAEVEHGKLGTQRASNPQVKAFAERMVADHTKASDELKTIAAGRGAQLGGMVRKPAHDSMNKLSKLKGAQFDREFMNHMVADHEKAVELFDKYSKTGKDADLKSYAVKTLPTLEQHLRDAVALRDTLKDAK